MTTSHFEKRCKQRGFSQEVITFVLLEGKFLQKNQDRCILTRKMFSKIDQQKYNKELLSNIEKKLPICVVQTEVPITVFKITKSIRYQKKRISGELQ